MGLSLLTRLSLSLPPAEPCNPEICEACNVPTTSLISGGGRGAGGRTRRIKNLQRKPCARCLKGARPSGRGFEDRAGKGDEGGIQTPVEKERPRSKGNSLC